MYKMVIVDDEYFTCEGLKILLDWKEMNIEIVGCALNGEEGINLVEQEKPDIIITDIRMNIMDGLTMIQKLRNNGFAGEVIVLSGYKVFEYAQKAMLNDVSCYLLKPITEDKMKEAITIVVKKLDEKHSKKFKEDLEIDAKKILHSNWAEVMKYIDDNITTDITLKDVASIACLEATYFSRLFKKKTGIGFLEYITQKRMLRAQKLLTHTQMHVKEIMYALSYKDEKYFRQLFKNFTGYSPTEYRDIYNCNKTSSEKEE